jgi:hypothetical protein
MASDPAARAPEPAPASQPPMDMLRADPARLVVTAQMLLDAQELDVSTIRIKYF